MKKLRSLSVISLLFLALLKGCATRVNHDYIMSGQVVSSQDKQVLICVSDTDKLKEHQVFKVYRSYYDVDTITEGEDGYFRKLVGKIRLGRAKDDHFAEAILLSGEIKQYDMVEFDREF